ncbi:hypothetical protein ACWDTP_07030 [Mycobacterium sp. NPDC003449]
MTERRTAWGVLVAALGVAILVATGLGVWQLVAKNRQAPPLAADQWQDRQRVTALARDSIVMVLSYTPETTGHYVDNVASVLTGKALDDYHEAARSTLDTARLRGVTQTSSVPGAAVESLTGDKAQVLVFVDQETQTRGRPYPTLTPRTIRVGMTKVDGSWLIDTLEPIEP